jgi:murein L,D-transpeptidase YafK
MYFCPQFDTMSSRGSGGRIRVTDDSFTTIGAGVEVRTEHTSAVNATKMRENAVKTRNEHRNRLKKLIAWWRTEYPEYFEVGTKVLSQQD